MPELPDIVVYVERLNDLYQGQGLERVEVRSPFVLRTFEPDIFSQEGRRVLGFRRHAKRIVIEFDSGIWLVLHLMIAGRFHQRPRGSSAKGKSDLIGFHFPRNTLMLTEAGKKHRAGVYCFASERDTWSLHRGGLEPLECTCEAFQQMLKSENHTLKRTLTDPRLVSGIGNAYSDEILHAAKMSPLKWTSRLSEPEGELLFTATVDTLSAWTERLRQQVGSGFPEKVTAFHPEMAVHGRFGQPCPVCGSAVQRIVYVDKETNYCATCQTEGKLLADRSLSRLLKADWPKTLE